jgi:hypothetical protein
MTKGGNSSVSPDEIQSHSKERQQQLTLIKTEENLGFDTTSLEDEASTGLINASHPSKVLPLLL